MKGLKAKENYQKEFIKQHQNNKIEMTFIELTNEDGTKFIGNLNLLQRVFTFEDKETKKIKTGVVGWNNNGFLVVKETYDQVIDKINAELPRAFRPSGMIVRLCKSKDQENAINKKIMDTTTPSTKGGKRINAGAKQKHGEPTRVLSIRVPESRFEEILIKVKSFINQKQKKK